MPSLFQMNSSEVLVESFSEDENEGEQVPVGTSEEIQQLLSRKVQLEKTRKTQELHKRRVQVSTTLF